MGDDPPQLDPEAAAHDAKQPPSDAHLRTQRLRAECAIPSRRRAMCCCAAFWLVVLALTAASLWGVTSAVASDDDAGEQKPMVRGTESVDRCRTLGQARCQLPHQAAVHKRREECPPGHTLSVVESGRLWGGASQARGLCIRRHFYPRVFDPSLVDTDVSVCADAYTHACGAWDKWFDADTGHRHALVSRNAQLYHTNVLPVLETSLADRDSVLHRFVNVQCRPLVTVARPASRDTPPRWLSIQEGAQLPIWLPELDTHTLCLLREANELVAPWFYALALDLSPQKAETLADRVRRVTSALDECDNTTTAWLGALGDPLIAQIEWQAPPHAGDHAALHARLGKEYGHMWSAASALAPYTWLAVGSGRHMVLRVAMPRDHREWMRKSHCERIAAVAFVEALEDRYTAMVRRARPEAVLAGVTQCGELEPRVSVSIVERPQQVRADVWQCVNRNTAANWHDLVAMVAACNAGHRMQPDQPLVDAFVPHLEATGDATHVSVHATPALLQAPWFTDEMELQSVAARLYWTLLREVASRVVESPQNDVCARESALDEWAFGAMGKCFRPLMDAQFWLELLQLHCGDTCPERWTRTLQMAQGFRHDHKCGSTGRKLELLG